MSHCIAQRLCFVDFAKLTLCKPKSEIVCVCNVSGGWQDETWPDGWTAVTRDGKRSAQFEHTLLVTETGCEILTRRLEDNGRAHFLNQM